MATCSSEQSDMCENLVDIDSNSQIVTDNEKKRVKKKRDAGVLYLSTIPPFMTVKKIREIFSRYGDVDRVFLQPEKKGSLKKPSKHFTEGWVEFKDKRVAKNVAALLNNKLIGGKRRSRFHDCIWSIKYLHRFKWVHLNERLAYEKASFDQRMRTEIAQAKRETNFYINAVEKNDVLQKLKKKNLLRPIEPFDITQRPTDEEVRNKKKRDEKSTVVKGVDKELLKAVFSGES